MSFLAAAQQFEFPRWWRIALIALGTLILCSCRAPHMGQVASSVEQVSRPVRADFPVQQASAAHGAEYPGLTPGARLGCPTCPTCPPSGYGGHGYGGGPGFGGGYGGGYAQLPFQPPLPSELRPGDEYLCDGGDQERPTVVGGDFRVYGLDVEDTVAHYDTVDGRRLVEPSNKVCVYAPRFAAVRQVNGMRQHEQHDLVGRVHLPIAATFHEESQLAAQFNQPQQPVGQIGTKQASTFRERNRGVSLEGAESLIGLKGREYLLGPLRVLETGVFDQSEEARLAGAIDAAITWSQDEGVQVSLGEQRLVIDSHDTKLGEIYVVEHEGTPKIRIIKVASIKEAQPGDVIEFTLRFDNIGDELIGNVTILDNLTTRLEYVEGSQSSTLEAGFFVEQNEAQSLALRWEVIEPLEPGAGGVITFKCRVR